MKDIDIDNELMNIDAEDIAETIKGLKNDDCFEDILSSCNEVDIPAMAGNGISISSDNAVNTYDNIITGVKTFHDKPIVDAPYQILEWKDFSKEKPKFDKHKRLFAIIDNLYIDILSFDRDPFPERFSLLDIVDDIEGKLSKEKSKELKKELTDEIPYRWLKPGAGKYGMDKVVDVNVIYWAELYLPDFIDNSNYSPKLYDPNKEE